MNKQNIQNVKQNILKMNWSNLVKWVRKNERKEFRRALNRIQVVPLRMLDQLNKVVLKKFAVERIHEDVNPCGTTEWHSIRHFGVKTWMGAILRMK